jgi:hypothetical protein
LVKASVIELAIPIAATGIIETRALLVARISAVTFGA